jgi:predicted DsbA family dithiol-disulfide isomerase
MSILPTNILKVDMVHDVVCSWSPIGYNNIKTAIASLKIEVDFRFLPFELNPEMGKSGESIAGYFHRQFGWDARKLTGYQKSLVTTVANAGVSIDFFKRKFYYNTRNAHLLMHWAERFNKQTALNERLILSYFNDGEDLSNLTVLLSIAEEIGLDRKETKAALASMKLNQQLDDKIASYKAFNIRSIPAFVIDETEVISGSNSSEFFEKILMQLFDESTNKLKLAL